MARNTTARRASLRDLLIDLAEETIITRGVGALRARDLARSAGCSVGAIYNAAGDLGEIILAVNARTFIRLRQALTGADRADAPAPDRLTALARGYLDFAAANRPAWRALFDYPWPGDSPVPEWYLTEMGRLLALIEAPLAQAAPDLSPQDRALFARTLFSAVHGIVLLGLEEASSGLPRDQLDRMLALLLTRISV